MPHSTSNMMVYDTNRSPTTLKRSRPITSDVCKLSCCISKSSSSSFDDPTNDCMCIRQMEATHNNTMESFKYQEQELSEETMEDFSLGPPPSCPPVLFRQNAMDQTMLYEEKHQVMTTSASSRPPRLTRSFLLH